MTPPLKMYSKFVLPNCTVFSHVLTMGQTIIMSPIYIANMTITHNHTPNLSSRGQVSRGVTILWIIIISVVQNNSTVAYTEVL